MSILKDIAIKLKDHDCKKIIRRNGNEITLTLPTIDANITKINTGLFSNKIPNLNRASSIAERLDNVQLDICVVKNSNNDPAIKINCQKLYLQILLAFTQLQSIFETMKTDPNPQIRKEIEDWIKYCDSLNGHANKIINSGIAKGSDNYQIEDIMRYQNITENEMDEALRELEGYGDTETAEAPLDDTILGRDKDSRINIIGKSIDKDIVSRNINTLGKNTEHLVNKIDSKIINADLSELSSRQTQIERYPCARFPDNVDLGDIVPLEVIIKSFKPSSSNYKSTTMTLHQNEQNEKEIPVQVIVECDDDGFEIDGKYYAIINVPIEVQDSNPVIFNIKAKKNGKHTIHIRFFQQTTYVGEIELESLVTTTKNQRQILVSNSQNKEWKSDYAILENVIPGPDITIFIHEKKSSSDFEYDVLIYSLDIPMEEMGPIKFPFNPETKFHKIFEDIENLSGNPDIIDRKLKSKCMSLYDELFPEKLKQLYWEKSLRIKSIRVISKEPWIPWEIIKPWRKLEDGSIEEGEFLCEHYAFSRWIIGKERIKNEVKKIKGIIPIDTKLDNAIKERNWIEIFALNKNMEISFDSSYDQIMKTFESEKEIDVLHFCTHGQSNKENPLLSIIELENQVQLRPEEIIGRAMTFGQSHPIVILNACQTGNQNFSLTGIQGWATKFLEAGASAFIGSLWSVNDSTAFNFVQEFYSQLASGISLGESVKNARNKCKKEGDTSWLAYQLYGHPNCTIKIVGIDQLNQKST